MEYALLAFAISGIAVGGRLLWCEYMKMKLNTIGAIALSSKRFMVTHDILSSLRQYGVPEMYMAKAGIEMTEKESPWYKLEEYVVEDKKIRELEVGFKNGTLSFIYIIK